MQTQRKYLIYKHTNLINNKVYIGQTCQKAKIRWQYGGGYKHNAHFQAAIKKYGWNNFSHEILFEDLTKEQADTLEIKLINEYKSYNENYGYNIARGGSSNTLYATKEEADLAHKKIQHMAYKKMIANEEYAQKMRDISLKTYYANKNNLKYMQARSKSNQKSRAKVHSIRLELKEYYIKFPYLFTEDEIYLAFSYKNNKSYNCNSSKKLLELLNKIKEQFENEERKNQN